VPALRQDRPKGKTGGPCAERPCVDGQSSLPLCALLVPVYQQDGPEGPPDKVREAQEGGSETPGDGQRPDEDPEKK